MHHNSLPIIVDTDTLFPWRQVTSLYSISPLSSTVVPHHCTTRTPICCLLSVVVLLVLPVFVQCSLPLSHGAYVPFLILLVEDVQHSSLPTIVDTDTLFLFRWRQVISLYSISTLYRSPPEIYIPHIVILLHVCCCAFCAATICAV